MTTEEQLRQRMRKIQALFEGATTTGERDAAAAALERIRIALGAAAKTERPAEFQFSIPDQWQKRLFIALCRRYGLSPFRYRRQRHSTVVVRVPKSFLDQTLWPEFQELKSELNRYLDEATERIIREEVYRDEGSERVV